MTRIRRIIADKTLKDQRQSALSASSAVDFRRKLTFTHNTAMQRSRSANHWATPFGVLLATAAAIFAGCDRPAVSQSPPATDAAADPAIDETRPAANAVHVASADVTADDGKPAVRQAAAADTNAAETGPSDDGPPRRSAIRPKADRGTTADGVEKITFDDLILGMQADMVRDGLQRHVVQVLVDIFVHLSEEVRSLVKTLRVPH